MLGDHELERLDGALARFGSLDLLGEHVGLGQRGEPAAFLRAVPGPDRRHDDDDDAERGRRLPGHSKPSRFTHLLEEDHVVWSLAASREPAGSTHTSPLTEAPSAAAKLPVLRDPVNTPVGRISTRVAAERLPRTVPPITIDRPLMLASTSAPGATTTRPVTVISPSKRPAM